MEKKGITIMMSKEEIRRLALLATVKKMSVSDFILRIVGLHLKYNEALFPLIEEGLSDESDT